MPVITSVIDSRDGVFIGGGDLNDVRQTLIKTMAPKKQPQSTAVMEMGGVEITRSSSGKYVYEQLYLNANEESADKSNTGFAPLINQEDTETGQAEKSAKAGALYSLASGTFTGLVGNTAGQYALDSAPSTGKIQIAKSVIAIATGFIANEGWQSSVDKENNSFYEDLAITVGTSLAADWIVGKAVIAFAGAAFTAPASITIAGGAVAAAVLGYTYTTGKEYIFEQYYGSKPKTPESVNAGSHQNPNHESTNNGHQDSGYGSHHNDGNHNGGYGYGYETAPDGSGSGSSGGSGETPSDGGTPASVTPTDPNQDEETVIVESEPVVGLVDCSDPYDEMTIENPNPEDDGTQGATSKPSVGPAPGDIGGKYFEIFNEGMTQGGRPSPDGNDNDGRGPNGPRPTDMSSSMNNDGDYGCDPIIGGVPAGGNDDNGFHWRNTIKIPPKQGSGFGNSGGGYDDLVKPNPEDDWGVGGPSSKSFEGNEIEKIFEFAGTQSFDSTSDFQEKDLMIASMSVDTFGL